MKDLYYLDAKVAAAYDAEHEDNAITTEDIPFYVGLARQAAASGHTVLELACGTGRVTLPMAAAGATVTGLDGSAAMLEVARLKPVNQEKLRWVEGDMTSFQLEERFGLVTIPFRSFLCLLTVADQKACLQRVHEHLIDGGRLALNFFNPNMLMMAEWLGDHRETKRLVERAGETERWGSLRYSPADQTLQYEQTDESLSDANAVISRVYRNMRLRYVFRYEMEQLLALCGFEVEALYGWFDERPFEDNSHEMVWIARKLQTQNNR